MKRSAAGVALILTLGLGTAACGGGSSSSSSQPPNKSGLANTARKFGEAVLDKDPSTTYEMLSKACQHKVSQSKWTGQLLLGIALLEGFAKVKTSDLSIGKVSVRNVGHNAGEATVVIKTKSGAPFGSSSDWSKWAYEDGTWRTTDCKDISSDSSSPTSTTAPDVIATTKFAKAPLERSIDGETFHSVTYSDAFTGDYTVTLDATRDLGTSITTKYSDPALAKGHFVGVKYSITNHTNGDLSMSSAFGSNARITDGKASWDNQSSASFDVIENEMPDASSKVGAGFTDSTWVVFDLPTTVTPVGLVFGLDAGHPITFGLPPIG